MDEAWGRGSSIRKLKKLVPATFRNKYRHLWRIWCQYTQMRTAQIVQSFREPDLPTNQNNKVNLHLGCGNINHPEFINIDVLPLPHIHYVRRIDNLKIFKTETVDLVYACHCLEHFPASSTQRVLQEWCRVLKLGGVLRVSVPDFDLLLRIYEKTQNNIDNILGPLMGGQGNKFDCHFNVFNEEKLRREFEIAGFGSVSHWEPDSTNLTTFDDWSGRACMFKGKNYLISLNMEAIK